MNSPARIPDRAWLAWLWLLLPLAASAWTRDWWAPDEPRYAEVAREVYSSGDFLVMHLCGEIYRNKPPLLFWISGFFGSLFHWNEFAMRLPSLASTLVSAWLTARLARRFWGEAEARLAPVLYLTTAMVIWHGSRMQIDPLLGALCGGALVLATEPCDSRPRRARLMLLAGVLTGLAILAKGPIALLLVGLPLLGWRWIQGAHAQRISNGTWMLTLVAALAPGLCWALAVIVRHPELAYDLFVGQFFERAVNGSNHISPFWYHFALQPVLTLPWTPLTLAGSWLAWRSLRDRRRGNFFDPGIAQAGWWFWSLLIAFSLSPEKRDLYLFPAYPAAALLGARWIAEATRARRTDRSLVLPVPALFTLIGLLLCSARLFQAKFLGGIPPLTWQPFAVGGPMAVGAAVAVHQAWRGAHSRATIALASGVALTACFGALIIAPLVNPQGSSRSLAAVLVARPERPSRIPCVDVMPEGFRFYSSLPVVHGPGVENDVPNAIEIQEHAFRALARVEGARFLALVARRQWMKWSEETHGEFAILHEQSVSGRQVLVLGLRQVPPR